jgi:hypothetical protein
LRMNGCDIQSQLRSWIYMPTFSWDESTFLSIRDSAAGGIKGETG